MGSEPITGEITGPNPGKKEMSLCYYAGVNSVQYCPGTKRVCPSDRRTDRRQDRSGIAYRILTAYIPRWIQLALWATMVDVLQPQTVHVPTCLSTTPRRVSVWNVPTLTTFLLSLHLTQYASQVPDITPLNNIKRFISQPLFLIKKPSVTHTPMQIPTVATTPIASSIILPPIPSSPMLLFRPYSLLQSRSYHSVGRPRTGRLEPRWQGIFVGELFQ